MLTCTCCRHLDLCTCHCHIRCLCARMVLCSHVNIHYLRSTSDSVMLKPVSSDRTASFVLNVNRMYTDVPVVVSSVCSLPYVDAANMRTYFTVILYHYQLYFLNPIEEEMSTAVHHRIVFVHCACKKQWKLLLKSSTCNNLHCEINAIKIDFNSCSCRWTKTIIAQHRRQWHTWIIRTK
jgi:hypothetical protein